MIAKQVFDKRSKISAGGEKMGVFIKVILIVSQFHYSRLCIPVAGSSPAGHPLHGGPPPHPYDAHHIIRRNPCQKPLHCSCNVVLAREVFCMTSIKNGKGPIIAIQLSCVMCVVRTSKSHVSEFLC